MSDKIDDILEGLDDKIKADGDNIKMEVVDVAEKDLKKVKEASQSDKKRVRRKIKKIKKMIGQDTPSTAPAGTKAKGTAKAKGTGGGNPDGVRCYIRYNNQGNPYRTCNDKVGLEKPKAKSVITPSIPPDEFAQKLGGYANLSDGQKSEYHRLWMREKREKEKAIGDGGVEAYRLLRLQEKEKKIKKKEEAIKERIENQEKYNKELGKLEDGNWIGKDKKIEALKKKYKIPKRIRKLKDLKGDIKDEKDIKEDIQKDIKKQKKDFKIDTKVIEHKDGKKYFLLFDD